MWDTTFGMAVSCREQGWGWDEGGTGVFWGLGDVLVHDPVVSTQVHFIFLLKTYTLVYIPYSTIKI